MQLLILFNVELVAIVEKCQTIKIIKHADCRQNHKLKNIGLSGGVDGCKSGFGNGLQHLTKIKL